MFDNVFYQSEFLLGQILHCKKGSEEFEGKLVDIIPTPDTFCGDKCLTQIYKLQTVEGKIIFSSYKYIKEGRYN